MDKLQSFWLWYIVLLAANFFFWFSAVCTPQVTLVHTFIKIRLSTNDIIIIYVKVKCAINHRTCEAFLSIEWFMFRVVQKNLVFVVGLSQRLVDPDVLKKHEYFGKFGKIHKVAINHSTTYVGAQVSHMNDLCQSMGGSLASARSTVGSYERCHRTEYKQVIVQMSQVMLTMFIIVHVDD